MGVSKMTYLNASSPIRASLRSKNPALLVAIQRSFSAYLRAQPINNVKAGGSAVASREPLCLHARTRRAQALRTFSATSAAAKKGVTDNYPWELTMESERHKKRKPPPAPRPSASVLLVSPTNQVLMLKRVQSSLAFPSAHVFPGGNLSEFHEGVIPPADDPACHEDSLAYRLGAIRETFEESGILLARENANPGGVSGVAPALLTLPPSEKAEGRRAVYANEKRFVDWVEEVGGVVDTDGLIPFTRWITPLENRRRFTTQMYLYMLPISTMRRDPVMVPITTAEPKPVEMDALIPTPDGGVEHTAAVFDYPAKFLRTHRLSQATLYPPQYYLLDLVSKFFTGPPSPDPLAPSESPSQSVMEAYYQDQRERLLNFIHKVPTASTPFADQHPTSQIPWAQKVMSPKKIGIARDERTVLAVDRPGPELKGTDRGGDYERVMLARLGMGTADIEVRPREQISAELAALRHEEAELNRLIFDTRSPEEEKKRLKGLGYKL